MLKGIAESILWNRTFTQSRSIFPQIFINYKGEKSLVLSGNHQLNLVTQVNLNSEDQINIMCLLICYTKKI